MVPSFFFFLFLFVIMPHSLPNIKQRLDYLRFSLLNMMSLFLNSFILFNLEMEIFHRLRFSIFFTLRVNLIWNQMNHINTSIYHSAIYIEAIVNLLMLSMLSNFIYFQYLLMMYIRLQQNWKVKRQRVAAPAPANEGFTIDLFDNSSCDPSSVFRPSSSTIRVDHDSSGMLAINLPPNSCHSLRFGFLSGCNVENPLEHDKNDTTNPSNQTSVKREKEFTNDDEYIKETNSLLRQVHHAIFCEQVVSLIL